MDPKCSSTSGFVKLIIYFLILISLSCEVEGDVFPGQQRPRYGSTKCRGSNSRLGFNPDIPRMAHPNNGDTIFPGKLISWLTELMVRIMALLLIHGQFT